MRVRLAVATLAIAALGAVVGGVVGPADRRARAAEPLAAADTAVTSRSIAFFERRLEADPGNALLAGRLIDRYVVRFGTGADLHDVARAEAVARDLVRRDVDRGAALIRLSGLLLMQHRFGEAHDAARAARALDGSSAAAAGALFDAALATGAYAAADSALARLDPGSLAGQVRRAQWLDVQGGTDGAFAALECVCRSLERSAARPTVQAWCLTELAGLEHGRRGGGAAARLLERALAVQPGYRAALEGLADLAHARGDWQRAERLYRRIAAEAHPDIFLRLAEIAERRGDPSASRRYEHRFLSIAGRPEREALYGPELALYLAGRGTPAARERAVAVARGEVMRRPTAASFDLLAWVLLRRGDAAHALAASNRSLALGPASPTAQYHRARILEALGRTDEAGALLRRATARRELLAPHARLDLPRHGA